jgi:hypothetical protein
MAQVDISKSIKEKGYWIAADAEIGRRVDPLVRDGFNFQTIEALDLCDFSILSKNQGSSAPGT